MSHPFAFVAVQRLEIGRRSRLSRAELELEQGRPRQAPACLCSRWELERFGCACAALHAWRGPSPDAPEDVSHIQDGSKAHLLEDVSHIQDGRKAHLLAGYLRLQTANVPVLPDSKKGGRP